MSLFDSASICITPNGVKEGKLYSIKPTDGSGDLSVTRATTATRVNSAGLVELVPVNLASYSEQFDNGYWSKFNNSVSANATTSPNGTLTADKEIPNTSNDIHGIIRNVGSFESSIYTASVYLKKSEYNFGWVRLTTNSDAQKYAVVINLTTGAMTTTNSSGSPVSTNYTIEQLPNDWFRLSVSMAHNSGDIYFMFGSCPTATPTFASTIPSFAGDGTSGIFACGGQLVQGSSAKDYYPTTTRLNIPRLDYTNGSCPSILVEPQRTNSCLYSEDITNSAWGEFGASRIANTAIAPSGVTNADTILPSATTATHGIFQQITTGSSIYTASAYFKANGYNYACIRIATNSDATRYAVVISLLDGSITSTDTSGSPTNTSYKVEDLENGWYRLSVSCNHSSGFIYNTIGVSNVAVPTFSNSLPSFTANGTSGIFIWGCQLEAGSYATSYIPTTSATVTRNADVISKTGISSLIGQTEGTIFIDFNINDLQRQTIDPVIFSTSGTNYVRLFTTGIISYFESNTVFIFSASNVINNGRNKIAVNYKNNDFSLYVNGALVGSNNSGSVVAKSGFGLNYLPTAFFDPRLFYNSIVFFPTKLNGAESITLTTI
jgi:hypothetical protein